MYTYTGSSLKFRSVLYGIAFIAVGIIYGFITTTLLYSHYEDASALYLSNLYLILILMISVVFGRTMGMAFAGGSGVVLLVVMATASSDNSLDSPELWIILKGGVFLLAAWLFGGEFFLLESELQSAALEIEEMEETINDTKADIENLQGKKTYLEKRYDQLERLIHFVQRLSSTMALDQVVKYGTATMREVIEGGRALVFLKGEGERFTLHGADPEAPKDVQPDDLDLRSVQTARSLLVRDVAKEFRIDARRVRRRCPSGSVMVAPVQSAGEVVGFLRMENNEPDSYSPDGQRLLSIMADVLGVAITNAKLYEKTQLLAQMDGLTDLYQRWVFNEQLREEINRADRYGYPFGLFMIDIDHFKEINDGYGHTVGDQALQAVASEIKKMTREGDFPARYGGEEFVVILTRAEVSQLKDVAHRLRRRIEENLHLPPPDGEGRVTVSIGVSSYPRDAVRPEELVELADRAMYRVKEQGRNDVRLYSEMGNE